MDKSALQAARRDLEIPVKPEKELKMTFEMSEQYVPFLFNKYLDWRMAAHISSNLLATCELSIKDLGGCVFFKAAPGFIHQLDKKTQVLAGIRIGASRGVYLGGRHQLDKDM